MSWAFRLVSVTSPTHLVLLCRLKLTANQNRQLWGQSRATSLHDCGLENHSHCTGFFLPCPIKVIEVNLVNLLLSHLFSSIWWAPLDKHGCPSNLPPHKSLQMLQALPLPTCMPVYYLHWWSVWQPQLRRDEWAPWKCFQFLHLRPLSTWEKGNELSTVCMKAFQQLEPVLSLLICGKQWEMEGSLDCVLRMMHDSLGTCQFLSELTPLSLSWREIMWSICLWLEGWL